MYEGEMLVCTLPQKAVRILQSNWDQYSNRKRLFDETEIPNDEAWNSYWQVETVPI
jgi:hypothetical protein